MFVGTTKAASLLGISVQRVRALLAQGRIKGAQKVGRHWQIRLYHGMPKISKGRRGPKGLWRQRLSRAGTFIHVNQKVIRNNKKHNTCEPAIAVKSGRKHKKYYHEVEIKGPCRLVYLPNQPKRCGATLWIEVDPSVELVTRL